MDRLKRRNFSNGKIRKLNYVIHNPNTVEETANCLLKVLIEVNESKVEMAIRKIADYGQNTLTRISHNQS